MGEWYAAQRRRWVPGIRETQGPEKDMIDKFNPYATLWPWIRGAPIHPTSDATDYAWATIRDSSDIIDCRHVMVMVAVLRALALHGHPVLFALGAPWSALTDEQAGRLTAEIVRRVGAHPATPKGVLPVGVLGPRVGGVGAVPTRWFWTRDALVGAPSIPEAYGGLCVAGWFCGERYGSETGADGMALAERAAIEMGAVMIEQITP